MRAHWGNHSRWTTAAIIVACWAFIGLLISPPTYLGAALAETPLSWGQAIALNLYGSLIWAAFTPLILWLGRMLPIERQHWLRNGLAHIPLALAIGTGRVLIDRATAPYLFHLPDLPYFRLPLSTLLVIGLPTIFMIYAGVLAVGHAVRYFRAYQERELRLTQATLEALKSQLNPHFLFNTLNAISELSYSHPEIAESTISRLSNMLRFTLEGGSRHEIPLRQELEFLHHYLDIQATLLGERLRVRLEIAPGTLAAMVPTMLLQPLVENAITHGIAPLENGGEISLTTRREGDQLRVVLCDSGPGFADSEARARSGIGLANTRARLRHLYGERQQLRLCRTESGGGCVNLTLPFSTADAKVA
ncbi:MAG: histidine kinase [Gammaproteobacteria bacterium]|jgi:signal transduction histidine kinase